MIISGSLVYSIDLFLGQYNVVRSLTCVQVFATPCTTAHQASLSFTISQSLLKPMSNSQWCHPTILSSVTPFSSCLQSFPASVSFSVSQLFTSDGQSIGATNTLVLPMNIQDWFPLGLTDWISLQSKGLSRVFSNTTVQSINSLALSFPYGPALISMHDY